MGRISFLQQVTLIGESYKRGNLIERGEWQLSGGKGTSESTGGSVSKFSVDFNYHRCFSPTSDAQIVIEECQ